MAKTPKPPKAKPQPVIVPKPLRLEWVDPSTLTENPANWRTHPEQQTEALGATLDAVGWAGACLFNERTGRLIDGHARRNLAIVRKEGEVPVLIGSWTEDEERLILATLDPLASMAAVDETALKDLLDSIHTQDEVLNAMLDELAASIPEAPSMGHPAIDPVEDEIPEPPAVPITKPGDVWILGRSRLMCGDSTNPANVSRLMAGELADTLVTSPPYAQQRAYTDEFKARFGDWLNLMASVFGIIPVKPSAQVLVNLGLVHDDGEWNPYWTGWVEWMRSQGWKRFALYTWDQGSGLPGDWNGRLAPAFEFVFHFNRQPVKPQNIIPKQAVSIRDRTGEKVMRQESEESPTHTNGRASLATHKIPDSVLRVQRQCGRVTPDDHHPAVFPVGLPALLIQAWPGIIYEPFSGSGSTLMASEQTGQRCFAMELSPAYCDIAVKRWERLTGKTAVLDNRGVDNP